jgi:hypothetical protein
MREMSMIARYVQIRPDELERILGEPSRIARLFIGNTALPGVRGKLGVEARSRLEQRATTVMSGVVPGLDRELRAGLARRLGVAESDLAGPAGAGALIGLIAGEAAQRRGDEPSADTGGAADHRELSLDKAWHGLHYLLTGSAEPVEGAPGSAVLGGSEVGDDDLGYGAARVFAAGEVSEIAAALGRDGLERELLSRYDPDRMSAAGIYPGGWDRPDQCDWLLAAFRDLLEFFADTAAQGRAVATCLV